MLTGVAPAQPIEFDWPVVIATDLVVDAVGEVDWNSDARTDLLVANDPFQGLASLQVWQNSGKGQFTEEFVLEFDQSYLRAPRAGDIDGDGDPDLAWIAGYSSNPIVSVWVNDGGGTGTLTELQLEGWAVTLELADIDRDGDLDLVTGIPDSGVVIHRNLGANQWVSEPALTFPDRQLSNLHVRNVDGVNGPDLLALLVDYTYDSFWERYTVHGAWLVIALNDGGAGFARQQIVDLDWTHITNGWPRGLTTADFDQDGEWELVVSGNNPNGATASDLLVFDVRDSTLTQVESIRLPPGRLEQVSAADLDADGDLDLTLGAYMAGFYLLENLGGRQFAPVSSFSTAAAGRNFVLSDLTGDGLADVVMGDWPDLTLTANITAITNPRLTATDLRRGEVGVVRVEGAEAGALVTFLASRSMTSVGRGVSSLGGLVLELEPPVNWLGSVVADPAGFAEFEVVIPPGVETGPIRLQAVTRRNSRDWVKTPLYATTIED
ncbi:MAG: FG-GAP repeat domain-containing protein [Phycisphaerales bacterium]